MHVIYLVWLCMRKGKFNENFKSFFVYFEFKIMVWIFTKLNEHKIIMKKKLIFTNFKTHCTKIKLKYREFNETILLLQLIELLCFCAFIFKNYNTGCTLFITITITLIFTVWIFWILLNKANLNIYQW